MELNERPEIRKRLTSEEYDRTGKKAPIEIIALPGERWKGTVIPVTQSCNARAIGFFLNTDEHGTDGA